MNLTVWLIDKSIKPHRFGVVKEKEKDGEVFVRFQHLGHGGAHLLRLDGVDTGLGDGVDDAQKRT